ncbi:putative growth hormone secretagogue receptor type 1 [Apostichopus japonicus]|uniref:Putative growth hormone secretagogue receptor type 1 n=1 Tax=Stichopus japonicus TaxID=307972 RepID=A0A2G8KXC3_STIJA|nr:putative growth hormone secretagogue receptor type 1 [Apostichopus japonicus]
MAETTPTLLTDITETFRNFTWTNETEEAGDGLQPGGLPPGWTWEDVLYVVFLLRMRLWLGFIGLVSNVMAFLIQIKLKSYRKTQFMFGFVLTVSEMFYIFAVLAETYYYYNDILIIPKVYQAIALATNLMVLFSIIGVGVDRYMALCAFPFKYKIIVTVKRYAAVIVGLTAISILYGFVFTHFFASDDAVVERVFIVVSVLLFITTVTYIGLCLIVRAFRNTKLGDSIKKVRMQQTKRLLFAFSLILITNGICYLPHSFHSLYHFSRSISVTVINTYQTGNWFFNSGYLTRHSIRLSTGKRPGA